MFQLTKFEIHFLHAQKIALNLFNLHVKKIFHITTFLQKCPKFSL